MPDIDGGGNASPGAHGVFSDVTVVGPNGPYASLFPAGLVNGVPLSSGTTGPIYDMGGYAINLLGPKYLAIGTWDCVAGTGDAAAAVQQAHDDLPSFGGIVWGPPGRIRIASTITWTKRGQLRCAGGYNGSGVIGGPTTFIKASTLNAPAFLITVSNGVAFMDFLVDGEAGNGDNGITIQASFVALINVHCHHMGADGVRYGSDTGANSNSCYTERCSFSFNGQHGMHLHDSVPNCNSHVHVRPEASNNVASGIYIDKTLKNTFLGPLTAGNDIGIRLTTNAQENIVDGGDPNESNTTWDILVDAGATSNVLAHIPSVSTIKIQINDTSTIFNGFPAGPPAPFFIGMAGASITIGTASHTRAYRVIRGGTITKVRLNVAVQSGNICVQAFKNKAGTSGLTAVPGTLLASSGSVACPAPGITDTSLGSTVTLFPGDWLAVGVDNITATFSGVTGTGDGTLAGGVAGDIAAFPAATNPTLTAQNNRMIELVGVP